METLTAIFTRRAVRNFKSKKISPGILRKILSAGRFAPSPLNSQPWHFIVIRKKETILKIASTARHGSFLSTADTVIVVTADRTAKVDPWLSLHRQHTFSAACAMENMWLAAWSLGIGCCWVTVDRNFSGKLLSIPGNQTVLGSLALGYPQKKPSKHREIDRKTLSDMVFYEKFGSGL